VLQRVAVCCSAFGGVQDTLTCFIHVAECCSVLQCVTVHCCVQGTCTARSSFSELDGHVAVRNVAGEETCLHHWATLGNTGQHAVTRCNTLCRSVLQCAAMCCSVLQCAASLQHFNTSLQSSLQSVRRSVLQCIAVSCSVMQ